MATIVLVIHLILALGIIGLVLLQRSEGGGLGIGGGGGGVGGLASAGTTANVLTKSTGYLAAAFFCTSLLLAVLAGQSSGTKSLLESIDNAPPSIDTLNETTDNKLPEASVTGSEDNTEDTSENSPKISAPSAPLSE